MTLQVPSGLAAMLGAGILAGLAPAASAAGVWLPAALVLAAGLAVLCGLSFHDKLGILGIIGRVAGVSAAAATFGDYLMPGNPVPAALGLVLAGIAVTAAGPRPPRRLVGVAVAAVLAVLVVFVVACLVIAPAPDAVPGSREAGGPAGLPAATALMFFGFLGFHRAGRRAGVLVAIAVALVVYLAVAGAALYQLGAARLALSAVPLRDALAAADASWLDPLVTAGAGIATALVVCGLLAELRRAPRPLVMPLAGAVAAGGAVLLSVPAAIAVASGSMLGHYALTWLGRDRQRQQDRARGEREL